MSNLAIISDPIPTNLEVSVTVTETGITTTPDTLAVPNGFDGTITWTITSTNGATFTEPALTFGGQIPPSFELSNQSTPTQCVRRWGNFVEQNAQNNASPRSYYYAVHAVLPNGNVVSEDPTVENLPPGT